MCAIFFSELFDQILISVVNIQLPKMKKLNQSIDVSIRLEVEYNNTSQNFPEMIFLEKI